MDHFICVIGQITMYTSNQQLIHRMAESEAYIKVMFTKWPGIVQGRYNSC